MKAQTKTVQVFAHEKLAIGEIFVLTESFNENLSPKTIRYGLHNMPAVSCRKNISGEWHPSAWLGSTNNINASSMGIFEIVAISPIYAPKNHKLFPGQRIGSKVKLKSVDDDVWDKFVDLNETYATGKMTPAEYWDCYKKLVVESASIAA